MIVEKARLGEIGPTQAAITVAQAPSFAGYVPFVIAGVTSGVIVWAITRALNRVLKLERK